MLVSQTRTHLGRPSFHVAAPVDLLELTFSTIWTSISLYDSSEVGSRPNSSHGHVISEYILKSSTLLNYWTIDWTRQPALIFPTSSPNATFLGVRTQGAMTPKFELGRDFCTMRLPEVSSSCVYSFGSYHVDKNTHKQTNKQMPLKTSNVLRYDVGQLLNWRTLQGHLQLCMLSKWSYLRYDVRLLQTYTLFWLVSYYWWALLPFNSHFNLVSSVFIKITVHMALIKLSTR